MRRLASRLLAALGLTRRSTLVTYVEHVDGRLAGLETAAARHEHDLAAQRENLERLERRVALIDRRAPARGRTAESGADLDALEGSLGHLAHRLDRIEGRRNGDRPAPRRLTFLTSIGPVDLDRQEDAIRSWLRYGDVVSLNGPEEGAGIRAALRGRTCSPLDDVTFRSVPETAVAEVGRPFVYVDSILDYIDEHGSDDRAFAVVNSDVILLLDGLVEQRALTDRHLDLLEAGPIFGSRVEVRADDLEPVDSEHTLSDGTYFWGFDYFIMTADQVAPLGRHRFVFGQPWWDYYLPIDLLHHHGVLFYLENRIALHVQHPTRWNSANFEFMGQRFARYRDSVGREQSGDLDAQDVCRDIRDRATRMRLPLPRAHNGASVPGARSRS